MTSYNIPSPPFLHHSVRCFFSHKWLGLVLRLCFFKNTCKKYTLAGVGIPIAHFQMEWGATNAQHTPALAHESLMSVWSQHLHGRLSLNTFVFLRIFSQLRGRNVWKRAISTLLSSCFQADSCVVLNVIGSIYWCLNAVLLISMNLTHSALKHVHEHFLFSLHCLLKPHQLPRGLAY